MEQELDELVTIDSILGWFKEKTKEKSAKINSPSLWVDAAAKLNALKSDETDALFELEQKVAQKKLDILNRDAKRNVSAAKAEIEASEEYKDMKKRRAKVEQIEEFIRIAKLQARLKETEYKGY